MSVRGLLSFLSGKKSYIAAICLVILALVNENGVNLELLLEAFGLASVRHALTKGN